MSLAAGINNADIAARVAGIFSLWVHVDPRTNSARETNSAGAAASRTEFDPLGNDVPLTDPLPPEMTPDYEYTGNYGNKGNPYDGPSGCTLDGQPVPCSLSAGLINRGAAAGCPNNNCGPRFNGSEWEFLSLTDEGMGYGGLNRYAHAQRRTPPTLKRGKSRPRSVGGTRPRTTTGTPQGVEQPRSRIRQVDFMTLINQRLTIENLNPGQESWVRYELQPLLTLKCDQAYMAEGLNSVTGIILGRGVVIRHADDLRSRSAADLGLDPQTYRDFQIKANLGQAVNGFGTDGRQHIFLNNKAFLGPSLDGTYLSLPEVLKHEFIHEGLKEWPAPTLLFGWARHDLAGFPGYDRIMKGCR